MLSFAFFVATFILTQIARRLGWSLSRRFLYAIPTPLAVTSCLMWGAVIAFSVHLLIVWLDPHWVVKWIFGYAQGSYAAIPNFGLVAEATLDSKASKRHQLISVLSLVSFIGLAIALAVLRPA